MYSFAKETESNRSVLDHAITYRDLMANKNTNGRDSVMQQNVDENISRRHDSASSSINDEQFSDLRQHYVNASKSDTHIAAVARLKSMIRQSYVTIKVSDMIQNQLNLQK